MNNLNRFFYNLNTLESRISITWTYLHFLFWDFDPLSIKIMPEKLWKVNKKLAKLGDLQ